MQGLTVEEIKKGLWIVDDAMHLYYLLDKNKPRKLLDLSFADEVAVGDPFGQPPVVKLRTHGRDTIVDSVLQELREAGVEFPPEIDEGWRIEGFQEKAKPSPSAGKRKAGSDGAAASSKGSGSTDSCAGGVLSEALHKRLKAKNGDATKKTEKDA